MHLLHHRRHCWVCRHQHLQAAGKRKRSVSSLISHKCQLQNLDVSAESTEHGLLHHLGILHRVITILYLQTPKLQICLWGLHYAQLHLQILKYDAAVCHRGAPRGLKRKCGEWSRAGQSNGSAHKKISIYWMTFVFLWVAAQITAAL